MTSTPTKPVSVLAAGIGLPSLRIPVATAATAWGGSGKGNLAICDADEDTLTLAWQAATEALEAAALDASRVSGVWWGTTRAPFAEGPSHSFLCASLGVDPSAQGALFSGSPHCGMEALSGAWDAICAGHAEVALVVASDALVPGPGTSVETTTGAAAAAFVLVPQDASAPVSLVGRCSRWVPVVDKYRADDSVATGDVYDARLFREEVYMPLLSEVADPKNGSAVSGGSGPPDLWAVSDPDGKLASLLAKRLGAPLASAAVQGELGDTGSASPLLGLIAACASDGGRPKTVGVIGYGGGRASAVTVEQRELLPGVCGLESRLASGSVADYVKVLRVRGQLEAMGEPIPMGLPPAGAAFRRGNEEMLLFEGSRCRSCGTISTPPSVHPACTGCGGDDLETVRLSRGGTVVTFVVNQTMPPPFAAPLPLLVVDLEDGARVMVQGTPQDAESLSVGDTVRLSLRRYALERGIPVYGYKASRAEARGGRIDAGEVVPRGARAGRSGS